MPPALNEIERKILDYMVYYLRTNTYQPSIREIGERFGIKSTKTVSEHLQALAEKGYLERDPSRSRGVKILGVDLSAQTVSIPCYGEIPVAVDQGRGEGVETYLSLDRRIAGAKGCFFVLIRGDGLSGLGLSEGDFALVEPATTEQLHDGDVVAAHLSDDPAFYRFQRNGGGIRLEPAADDVAATVVEAPEKLDVRGRVTAIYRRMDGVQAIPTPTAH